MRTLALAIALAATGPAMAEGARGDAPNGILALPIDMMATVEADDPARGPAPSADASAAEIAYGLFQRGAWGEAREAAEPLAAAGDGAMAVLLARIHGEGLGTPVDPALALEWLEKAAAAGDVAARHDLAIMRLTGSGVQRDDAAALDALRALAARGRAVAAFDLAQALLGPGRTRAERDEGEAALRAAADAGLPRARHELARYIEANLAPDDSAGRDRAVRLLVSAARSGLPDAQMELGDWLMSGRAGLADRDAARGWIERAARSGLPVAIARLRRMDAARDASRSALPGVDWDRRGEPPAGGERLRADAS